MTDNQKLAELVFGDVDKTPEYYESLYPERQLPEGARVTRLAPSPTGYLHIGGLFMGLINRRMVDANGGVFFLRIEDTDSKREVDGGVEAIVTGLHDFGIIIDEGFVDNDTERGNYGPYRQSQRAEIYHCFAKKLMAEGLAYPCFCTEECLADVRAKQEAEKERTGYYGKYAACRQLPFDEVKRRIDAGEKFVVRLRSPGKPDGRITFDDGIKGKIELPENDEDFVLLKSDGIPTYHFAHAVDDHLMRTTHIIRGDEWIASVPKHIQLFRLLGFKVPKYNHAAPIMKEDNGGKRKLSKRKDPEAAVSYYAEQGYPADSVTEYLLTIANSDYEDWRRANPDLPHTEFKLNIKKMSASGALFDIAKLNDVSKNVISRMSAEHVYDLLLGWARQYDSQFAELLGRDADFARGIFAIDRGGKKPRKDIAKWSEAKDYCQYFFDELYRADYTLPEHISAADAVTILRAYKAVYNPDDERDQWFDKIKSICPSANFCPEVKTYKADPDSYRGHSGDAATIIRIALTGRMNTPDLCAIMRLLGTERVNARIDSAINFYERLV